MGNPSQAGYVSEVFFTVKLHMIRLYILTSLTYSDKKGISGHAMFAFQEGLYEVKYQLSFKQSSIKTQLLTSCTITTAFSLYETVLRDISVTASETLNT